ncbi:excisionase family DNA binding protein [Brachybacterium sp. AG952]|uniref:helix-turn-helix domain-containing protein n=1 Tax=Brachybacterium sp. AG952 TaxID=2183989 RepID=UPI00105CF710|nr:helix-turn-helix domain-containing protein [Brachybacterium sp. AG952]TDP78325.1 excisionase family DNA binding protein [Brachybacterium sp. AG952]
MSHPGLTAATGAAQHTSTPRYIPLSEGAEYLSLTTAGLRKYIAEGRITGYRLGKRAIRVDVRELDALLTPIPAAKSGGAR